jgi:hypothetical protein
MKQYTLSEVEELLRKQRELCRHIYHIKEDNPLFAIEEAILNAPAPAIDEGMIVGEVRESDRFFAVAYCNYWGIQIGQYYGDKDILNAEDVGEKEAEDYANLIVKLLNAHYGKND